MRIDRFSNVTRRAFLKQGALGFLALGLPPDVLVRPLLAGSAGLERKKSLICIFQRGAVDGLSMVVPHGEEAYYRSRTRIAIPRPGAANAEQTALDLDGFFGLHPAMGPIHGLWDRGELAVVQAVGSPHPTRSHFEAQDNMELGLAETEDGRVGWLNRVLSATEGDCAGCAGRTLEDPRAHAADHAAGQVGLGEGAPASLRGVSLTAGLPVSLQGPYPAMAIPDLTTFGVAEGRGGADLLNQLYSGSGEGAIAGAETSAAEAAAALRVLDRVREAGYTPARGVRYPRGPFGRSLQQIAQLLKSGVGVEIAFVDLGGWDTHANQGNVRGQLAGRLGELAAGIRALYDDLGDRMEDVVVLTMSEFGRTVEQNGSGGTDHGHANAMMIMGGPVAGGRVMGDWPGLEPEQRFQGRDLAVTTDFRDVFGEVARSHLGVPPTADLFPGYSLDAGRFRGILRSG